MFLRAEPKKKKKVDPRREQVVRDRLKKKLKKLEKVPPELIPIEDLVIPTKCLDETRYSDLCCGIVNLSAVLGVVTYIKNKAEVIQYFSYCQQMHLRQKKKMFSLLSCSTYRKQCQTSVAPRGAI